MLEIEAATPLPGRCLRLTLSDGRVVERDVSDLLWGPVFERVAASDEAFAEVTVANGTVSWLRNGADIAPETLIWNGPEPSEGSPAVPAATLRVVSPDRARPQPDRPSRRTHRGKATDDDGAPGHESAPRPMKG